MLTFVQFFVVIAKNDSGIYNRLLNACHYTSYIPLHVQLNQLLAISYLFSAISFPTLLKWLQVYSYSATFYVHKTPREPSSIMAHHIGRPSIFVHRSPSFFFTTNAMTFPSGIESQCSEAVPSCKKHQPQAVKT